MSENTTKREFTRSDQAQPKTENKRFKGKCFYCGKQGHRKQECRGSHIDEANGVNKLDAIQPTKRQDEDKPKYNPKLVCHICGYTGHSARYCRKRIPKQTSSPYGQLPYKRTDEQENKERRRELKQQQRPMNQMDIQDNDEDPSSEGEQDFQQSHKFTPRPIKVRTHTLTQRLTRLEKLNTIVIRGLGSPLAIPAKQTKSFCEDTRNLMNNR